MLIHATKLKYIVLFLFCLCLSACSLSVEKASSVSLSCSDEQCTIKGDNKDRKIKLSFGCGSLPLEEDYKLIDKYNLVYEIELKAGEEVSFVPKIREGFNGSSVRVDVIGEKGTLQTIKARLYP